MSETRTATSAGDGAAPPPTAERTFSEGTLIAERYRIVRFVAAGGMGEVYEADDLQLGKRVAVKALPPTRASERAIRRFRREISLAQGVTHPSVCRIHDLGFHGATAFLTMELLEGETLSDRIASGGPISMTAALPLVEQMAAALDAAHEAGIVHRDFKSRNVMLVGAAAAPGSIGRAVVTDFGLAVQRDEVDDLDGAPPGAAGTGAAGTPGYMAPEQRAGARLTRAVDIYALGIVLHELLTGRLLVDELDPGLDPRVAAIVRRCVAKDPADRYPSAGDVAAALAAVVHPPRRRRLWPWIAAALGLLVAAGGAIAWRARSESPAPPPHRRVAILGFRDLAPRAETAWLATALRELVAADVAGAPGITVVSGEATQQARELVPPDTDLIGAETLARLHERLDADVVLAGSYLAQGERATIQLVIRAQDTRTGATLVSVQLLGSPDGVGHLASRAAERVLDALGVRRDGTPHSPGLPITAAPADPEAAHLYFEGVDRLRAGEAVQARAFLEQARARAPDDPHVHLALGAALADMKHPDAARELERARELAAGLSEELRLYVDARLLSARGDSAGAAPIFTRLFDEHPDNPEYANRAWSTLLRSGDRQGADRIVERMRASPALRESTQLLWMELLDAHRDGELSRALELAERLARRAERDGARGRFGEVRHRSAAIRYAMGDLDGASAHEQDARRANAAAFGYEFERSTLASLSISIALERGDVDEAMRLAELHLEFGRRNGDRRIEGTARQLRAGVLLVRDEREAARRELDTASSLFEASCGDPCLDWVQLTYAELALADDRPADARVAAERAVSTRTNVSVEDRIEAHRFLSLASLALGERAEARAQAALALDSARLAGASTTWRAHATELRVLASSGKPDDLATAARLLEQLAAEATEKRFLYQSLLLRAQLAEVLDAAGDRARAQELARSVATEARSKGFLALARRAAPRNP